MIPSLEHYATHDESEYPEQWIGNRLAVAPCLGVTGPRLFDLSRFGSHGEFKNMDPSTDWVINDGRYEIDLDGQNDFVDFGNQTAFAVPYITFSLWCRPRTANQAPFGTIFGKCWTTTHVSPFFSYKFGCNFSSNASGPYSLEVNISGTPRGVIATFGPSAGRLDFLCATFDGATLKFYINGLLNGSASFPGVISFSNGPLRIGANANGAELFSGAVDDIHVSSRPISANEVWERYEIGRGGMYMPKKRRPIVIDLASSRRRRLLLMGQT